MIKNPFIFVNHVDINLTFKIITKELPILKRQILAIKKDLDQEK